MGEVTLADRVRALRDWADNEGTGLTWEEAIHETEAIATELERVASDLRGQKGFTNPSALADALAGRGK